MAVLARNCEEFGIRLYAMTKQFGRNPDTCAAIAAGGISSAVTVDMQDMEAVRRGPLDVGHVGQASRTTMLTSLPPPAWMIFNGARPARTADPGARWLAGPGPLR